MAGNCPHCNAVVEQNAKRCPKCNTGLHWRDGEPVSVWKSKGAALAWKIIITMIVIAIVVMAGIMALRP